MNKSRFEAFSDGVFAFAITLLVLGFAVPMDGNMKWTTNAALTQELLKLWPNLLAYILSFAVIGIMWQNHHALFRTVARIDRKTVFLNLLLLGAVAFIPFATATLGAYPSTHAATFLYGVVLSISATAYNLILMHLVRSSAFHASVDAAYIRTTATAYRVGWLTYALATVVALFLPRISFGLYLAIALYYLVPRGLDDDLTLRPAQDGIAAGESATR